MRRTFLHIPLLCLFVFPTYAQDHDLTTVDGIIEALYASISGPAGDRDWDFFRSLYTPNAIMGAMTAGPDGKLVYRGMTPDSYVERNAPFFKQNGFWEKEIGRNTIEFGELVHVFSAYEFKAERNGEEIKQRGVNSVQLVKESDRWYIVSIQWNSEREDLLVEDVNIR